MFPKNILTTIRWNEKIKNIKYKLFAFINPHTLQKCRKKAVENIVKICWIFQANGHIKPHGSDSLVKKF